MPRTISLVCSGICALLTTALSGQALITKPTPPQQVTRSVLQQQRAWNHHPLTVSPALFRSGPHYSAHNFLHNRRLETQPASMPPYGFSIRQAYPLYTDYRSALRGGKPDESFELLHLYLQRYNGYYAEWQSRRKWSDPQEGLGVSILRGFIENKMPPPPGTYYKRN